MDCPCRGWRWRKAEVRRAGQSRLLCEAALPADGGLAAPSQAPLCAPHTGGAAGGPHMPL